MQGIRCERRTCTANGQRAGSRAGRGRPATPAVAFDWRPDFGGGGTPRGEVLRHGQGAAVALRGRGRRRRRTLESLVCERKVWSLDRSPWTRHGPQRIRTPGGIRQARSKRRVRVGAGVWKHKRKPMRTRWPGACQAATGAAAEPALCWSAGAPRHGGTRTHCRQRLKQRPD